MQHNTDGRRKKERHVADNLRPRSYHDQHLQQPAASAPILSRLRNFNNLALTSIGSFFSGSTITKAAGHLQQDEAEFSKLIARYGNKSNADTNRHSADEGYFWLEDPQSCLFSPDDDDLTPIKNEYHNTEAVDYCGVKQLSSLRLLGTHDNLNSSDSNLFPLDASALIKNNLPLVQRANSSHAHTSSRPDVRHLFGNSRRPDTLNEDDIQDADISTERSNIDYPGQLLRNPLQLKSTATPERATTTTLCASAAVFVPSSPAAHALLSRNKSSMASFQSNVAGLDATSVDTETPPLTPDSSKTGLLSPETLSTSFEHVVPSHTACSSASSNRMPGDFRIEDDDDDNVLYTSPQLLEVKEGKKREQPYVRPKSPYYLHHYLYSFNFISSGSPASTKSNCCPCSSIG